MSKTFDLVRGTTVAAIIEDKQAVSAIVESTYRQHGAGRTTNPDSYFLKFADRPDDRIIALPARIQDQGGDDVAGIKWISSFPGNVASDLPRASAILVLNSMADGYPYACLEAAGISAARTAAGAAVTLRALQSSHPLSDGTVSIFGAGVIARTIIDYLIALELPVRTVLVCDPHPASAEALIQHIGAKGLTARAVTADEALESGVVITATTAAVPYISRPPQAGQVYLNVSLRDFTVAALAGVQNLVDDVDHCLKAQTSPHLAEQAWGSRDFITGTIPELLSGDLELDPELGVVVSPFGLGVLDLAVAAWVHRRAVAQQEAVSIDGFFASLDRWA